MKLNNLFYFLMLAAYILATIGGFGYAVYGGSWPVAIAIIALAYMAFPTAKEYWKKFSD